MKARTDLRRWCWIAGGQLGAACGVTGAAAALAEGPEGGWSVLVYGAVDNNADMPFIQFMDKVRKAADDDPGVELLVFIDRAEHPARRVTYLGEAFSGARLYRVRKDSVERLAGGEQFPELGVERDAEVNSADAETLGRFIAWGKAQSPQRRHALLIYSHANGATMCPDEHDGAEMGIAELTEEIGPEGGVEFLALELCQMGGIEIAYQWRPESGRFAAEVLLAIPNAGPPLDWDRAFARIRSPGHALPAGVEGAPIDPAGMTGADFGRLVIEEGRLGRESAERSAGSPSAESAACYDLRGAGAVKSAVDALAGALAAGSREAVLELRGWGWGSGPGRSAICYGEDGSYVDLYDLCRRVQGSEKIPGAAREAAGRVTRALERFMIASFGMRGYSGFEAGRNGVFIVLPSGKDGCWERLRWYTPYGGTGRDYGRWSFLADGGAEGNGRVETWFELMDSWFDAPGNDGGVNGYRP